MKIVKIDNTDSLKSLERHPINVINWAEDFPEKPEVDFAIAHDGDNLYINYKVKEETSLARVLEDNGEVWTDSCVEFFVSFDETGYYNFEFNCIGTALSSFRKDRTDAVSASKEILSLVKRDSSLSREVFEEKHIDEWQLTVTIPKEAFFKHSFDSLSGISASANFYKCGDNLTKPHFVSWNAINNATPNFHLPKFFGKVEFE